MRTKLLLPLLLLPVVACGIKDQIDAAKSTADAGLDADADAGSAEDDVCAMDNAVKSCDDTECVFAPADVDCVAACNNIAAVCAANACDENCTGLESDASLCAAGCEGSKAMACSNLVFGCYADNATCEDVGSCVEANRG